MRDRNDLADLQRVREGWFWWGDTTLSTQENKRKESGTLKTVHLRPAVYYRQASPCLVGFDDHLENTRWEKEKSCLLHHQVLGLGPPRCCRTLPTWRGGGGGIASGDPRGRLCVWGSLILKGALPSVSEWMTSTNRASLGSNLSSGGFPLYKGPAGSRPKGKSREAWQPPRHESLKRSLIHPGEDGSGLQGVPG